MQLVIVNGEVCPIHLIITKIFMKKIITRSIYAGKCLFKKAFGYACRLALQKKMLLTGILLTNVLIASFSQKASVFLSSYDSCHVRPPQQQQTAFAIKAAGSRLQCYGWPM